MKRALILSLSLSLLALAACKEEVVQTTDPVGLTAESIGHFCQMNLLEHPGPKAQVHLEGLPGAPLFFSQVRDAVAYARLRNPLVMHLHRRCHPLENAARHSRHPFGDGRHGGGDACHDVRHEVIYFPHMRHGHDG